MPETTLLLGGRIYTPTAPDATAMALTGGTVTWVGQDRAGRALYPDARTENLGGAFVAPAFVDAHVHATSTGIQLGGLDLTTCRSAADCLAAVRSWVDTHPGQAVLGHGWEQTRWPEERLPSRAELDRAAGDIPVYLSRIDVHSALVSTALVELVPAATAADGYSEHGPLSRQAHHHARRAALSSLTPADRSRAHRTFLRHAAGNGVACVHECAGPDISSEADLTELLALSRQAGTPEVVGYWGELGATATAARLGAHGAGGDLFADGALGSRTAALSEPYSDDPGNHGVRYLDAARVAEHLVACVQAGIQGGFHVIGDAALAEVVAGAEQAAREIGAQAIAAGHHRLEHVEMIDALTAERLAALGMIACMQPLFDAAWGGTRGQYASRLGVPRGTTLNPFATVAAAGMPLALGSDSPVTPVAPWAAVQAAVHHRTEGSGISPRAAFTAHTRGGHRATGVANGTTGTLAPGAPATYAVWEAGELGAAGLPRIEPDAELPRCRQTVLRGEVIYDGARHAP